MLDKFNKVLLPVFRGGLCKVCRGLYEDVVKLPG